MNEIYKSLTNGENVALSVLDTTNLVQDGIDTHHLKDGDAKLFGNLLTFAAYLGSTLKSEGGELSVTLKTDSGSVSVSCDSALHVRGCMGGDSSGTLKGGTLNVISEDGYSRPFVGVCLMESDDLNENLQNYFRQSAQVVTFVNADCKIEGSKCLSAGAVIGSCLPDAPFSEVENFRLKLKQLDDISQKICEVGAKKFSEETFGGEPLGVLMPVYKCNCSREKISQVVKSVGKTELKSIIAEFGVVTVHCHYCNKDYIFDEQDVEKLF